MHGLYTAHETRVFHSDSPTLPTSATLVVTGALLVVTRS